ncbi:MAG TPA: Xaa-Pro peptidase family protein [Solirubrobacteraceae bacterium]|nr:Xaa-Pro peptidase family protein [Solirubrobacteraceae bacterium]
MSTTAADRLIERLPDAGIDVLLVTNLVNVRYLTGYTGSSGIALVGSDVRTFITDFRYVEQAAAEVDPAFDRHRSAQRLLEGVEEALAAGELRMGFEAGNMTVSDHAKLRELLPTRIELVATSGLVEELRAVKQPDEVAAIKAAAALADEAFARLIQGGLTGSTEYDLALKLEYEMRRRGATKPSFDPIVAAGPHGALPHASPRDVEINRGELVVIDWGAQLDGYCSDCTRTLATGPVGSDVVDIYELVLDAQLAALEDVKPGAVARDVDSVARAAIAAGGYGEQFGHSLGHGVGLEVHEAPRLAQPSEAVLAAGNVVTVEPGIYLPGRFGVRIEDLVVVTGDGRDILTSISKDLTIVD